MSKYRKLSHVVYRCDYHVVFAPKYRFRILTGAIAELVEHDIRALAAWRDVEVWELSVQADHVHLVCSIPPKVSVSQFMGLLKGKLAIKLFKSYPKLRRKPYWGNCHYPIDMTTPITLAQMFGASIHSTFRRWIEEHEGALCGIVLDTEPVCAAPMTFRRHEIIRSRRWQGRFGSHRFPRRLTVEDYSFLAPLAAPWSGSLDTLWSVDDRDGVPSKHRVQSFDNTYRTFVLLWVPATEGLIARRRRRPKIAVG